MKLKQLSVAIENSPGRLFEIASALGEAGINLRALNLVDTGDFGLLRLLVSDLSTTRRILMQKHISARVDEVVAAEIEDRPGTLAQALKHLSEAQVNVNYMYAFTRQSADKAVMIFRFSDNDQAIQILQKHHIRILNAEAFGILDTEA